MTKYKPGRLNKWNPTARKGSEPPKTAGEYRIRTGNNRMKYIGETNNLDRRINEHIKSGKIRKDQTVEWQEAKGTSTSNTRRKHETGKIEKHKPFNNKRGGGGGRPSGK